MGNKVKLLYIPLWYIEFNTDSTLKQLHCHLSKCLSCSVWIGSESANYGIEIASSFNWYTYLQIPYAYIVSLPHYRRLWGKMLRHKCLKVLVWNIVMVIKYLPLTVRIDYLDLLDRKFPVWVESLLWRTNFSWLWWAFSLRSLAMIPWLKSAQLAPDYCLSHNLENVKIPGLLWHYLVL